MKESTLIPKTPIPNVPLFRKVLEHIDAHPEEWNQLGWAQKTQCGTAFCFAGHVAIMEGWVPLWEHNGINAKTAVRAEKDGEKITINDIATKALGITDEDAYWLFAANNTRTDLQEYVEEILARTGERL